MNRLVYLDYAATTPVDKEVLELMQPYFSDKFGNPSSIHRKGQEAKKALDGARIKAAELLNCKPEEIVFTSGGTESDNLALKGVMEAAKENGKNHLIISKIEHPAVLKTAEALEKSGFKVDYLPVDKEGVIRINELEKLIREETALVSIIYANSETGTIQSIKEISKLIKTKNPKTFFHTDAIQAFNYLDCNVEKLGVDLLSLSGQKIYGPKGVGLLYIKQGTKIDPVQTGGEHEIGKRAGTENIPGIVGMVKAMELADEKRLEESRRLQELRNKLIEGIRKNIKGSFLSGSFTDRLCNNVNFCFSGVEGEALVMSLDVKGVMGSSGSACSSAKLEPSHVLAALDIPPELAQGSLRLTLGRDTTEEDINYVLEILPEVIERLRSISAI
ncbi:cysteine desulfurase family protein [Patescibacteria group bacterium]